MKGNFLNRDLVASNYSRRSEEYGILTDLRLGI